MTEAVKTEIKVIKDLESRDFDVALENNDYRKIMDSVCYKFRKRVDPDIIQSIKLTTLWECLNKFDPTKGCKFTSFLYNSLRLNISNSMKRRKYQEFTNIPFERYNEKTEDFEIIIDALPEESKSILRMKFQDKMTIEEIGKNRGYSRETARRNVAKAIELIREINGIEIE